MTKFVQVISEPKGYSILKPSKLNVCSFIDENASWWNYPAPNGGLKSDKIWADDFRIKSLYNWINVIEQMFVIRLMKWQVDNMMSWWNELAPS